LVDEDTKDAVDVSERLILCDSSGVRKVKGAVKATDASPFFRNTEDSLLPLK
jgi:hypothetical protein